MIHTDGRPTIANAGTPLPEPAKPELPPEVMDLARALAASHSLTVDEAMARLTGER